MSNISIVNQVRSSLAKDPKINLHAHQIEIAMEPEGALVLEGEVPSIAAKKLALSHAAQVSGVSGIVDRLRVTPAKRMGDGEIRDHVRDALLEEPALDPCGIRVEESGHWRVCREVAAGSSYRIDVSVHEGVVTLDGVCESLVLKRLIGALTWWVPGTRDVINGVEVSPPEEDSDDEITEAVKFVLEKDPLVNAGQVLVRTRNAIVTLEGMVANSEESDMVATDAWCIVGVERVENRLELSR